MKIRTVKITSQQFLDRLQGKAVGPIANLPSDAELLDVKLDLLTGQILAVVRSDTYENVSEAKPVIEMASTTEAKRESPAPAVLRTIIKSNVTVKPEIIPSRKPLVMHRPKQNSRMMEEEFSAEQRKLLSFSVEGDFVIVKPLKFLKAEWEDINEVVRSVGGRWVKGDIISYWEIPLPKTE
jgi:hypothetical protein